MKKILTILVAFVLVFTLAGCKPAEDEGPTDADLVAEAKTALLLTNLDAVTQSLTLPTTGLHGSVITWASSNTAFLSNSGAVTRPAPGESNAVVTLTATITINAASLTKDFVVRIIAAVPTLDVTIAEFISSAVKADDDVVVTGVVFGLITAAGYHITDGTGYLYVYTGVANIAVIGDEIEVTGKKTIYYGLPELYQVTSVEIIDSNNTLPAYIVTSMFDLSLEDPYDTMYNSAPITVTGILEMRGTDVALVAVDANFDAHVVLVYYKSDTAKVAEMAALAGKMVTADVIVYGFHSSMLLWRVTVNSTSVVTSTVATNAQLAAYEASKIDLGLIDEVTGDLSLNLVGSIPGTTIAWASNNEAVVSPTGVVTRVSGSDTVVTLTATVTVGTATAVKTIMVTVLDLNFAVVSITVAEALAAADDAILVVEGVVSGFNGSSNMIIQDADGTAIVIYTSNFASNNNLALGDKIIVRGTRDTYYGLNELVSVSLISVVSSGNTVLEFTDVTVAQIVADMAGYQGHNIVLTNLVVVDLDYDAKTGYVVVGDGAGNNLIFYAGLIPYSDTFLVGDIISELSVIVYDVYYSGNRVVVYAYPGLSDAEALIAAGAALSIPETAIADITLPLVDTDYPGLTIAWASDTPLVVSDAGVVVRPEAGMGDATVVLTATLSLGTETPVVVTFTVTVPQIVLVVVPDIFISEYIEGSSNNKAIELYNPTGADVLLTGYVINYYNNGSPTVTKLYDLTGITILAGNVYVICTDTYAGPAVCDEIQAWADLDSVVFFNGDDAMELMKDGVAIDVIGVIGEDPGTNWVVGTGATSEFTLVRDASVVAPNAFFTPSEWIVLPQDTFEFLGSHPAVFPDVFFSEYIEGSSNNKAIELYNPTGADVLLDGYVINYYNNGSPTVTKSYDLAGITILAGDVYVLCTDTYTGPAVCDEIQAWADLDSVVFFNGDDAMELMKDGIAIDVIGLVGEDPGTNWPVGTGATSEFTLVRIPSVVAPNGVFTPAEWTVYPQDTFEHLGTHTVN